jgi:hypothetical protein
MNVNGLLLHRMKPVLTLIEIVREESRSLAESMMLKVVGESRRSRVEEESCQ